MKMMEPENDWGPGGSKCMGREGCGDAFWVCLNWHVGWYQAICVLR
jgi:hypothetical protein